MSYHSWLHGFQKFLLVLWNFISFFYFFFFSSRASSFLLFDSSTRPPFLFVLWPSNTDHLLPEEKNTCLIIDFAIRLISKHFIDNIILDIQPLQWVLVKQYIQYTLFKIWKIILKSYLSEHQSFLVILILFSCSFAISSCTLRFIISALVNSLFLSCSSRYTPHLTRALLQLFIIAAVISNSQFGDIIYTRTEQRVLDHEWKRNNYIWMI